MLNSSLELGAVAYAIQLAIGPVFLLTGIAGLLNVMTGRLARIIDRGRQLTEQPLANQYQSKKVLAAELSNLEKRRYLTSAAITASTASALLVCMVVVALFSEALLQIDMKWLIGALFASSTAALVIGLGYFLREVHLATRTVHILPTGNNAK